MIYYNYVSWVLSLQTMQNDQLNVPFVMINQQNMQINKPIRNLSNLNQMLLIYIHPLMCTLNQMKTKT